MVIYILKRLKKVFYFKKVEKWHTHIVKQQIKITFSFVMQQIDKRFAYSTAVLE